MEKQRKATPFQALIFDFDGTLVDSMNLWDHLAGELLEKRGISAPEGLDEILAPMSTEQSANYLVKKYNLGIFPADFVKEMYEAIEEKYRTQVQIKPFVGQYLQKKYEQGYPMCVATANSSVITQQTLRRLGIFDCFSFIMTCDELGLSKQEPEFYSKTAEKLGFPPEETLVFEDTLHSARAAKEAGCLVAGIFDLASWKDEREMRRICDYYLTSFSEWA
ncbi:MAG TPA: HAD family phosphatase [Firmicutes bacterium]|nr:HAD family phosphatase [Bacillota bacterium]